MFWEGFEKKALNVSAGGGGAKVIDILRGGGGSGGKPFKFPWLPLLGLAALGKGAYGALSSTESAKKTNKAKAEAASKLVQDAKRTRVGNISQYIANPATPGPLSELGARIARRYHASMADHPVRTSVIPFYGVTRGGKAGEKGT